jgi:hypothetical protein
MSDSRQPGEETRVARRHRAKCKFPGKGIASAVIGGVMSIGAALPAQAATVRTGVVNATLTITFSPAPPAGSTVSCGVSLIGNDSSAPSDSKSTRASVSSGKATCHIIMRYRWSLVLATSKMAIAYSVSGPSQSSAGIYSTISVPANGATTKIAIAISQ